MKKVFSKTMVLMFSLIILFTSLSFNKPQKPLKLPKLIKKQFAFIKGGGINGIDAEVSDFYISKYEISNIDYREFLSSLKRNGKMQDYEIAKIDTSNWISEFEAKNMKPFASYYHIHPAYYKYPVVNISIEAAKLYCKWLTEILNSNFPNLDYKIEIRLPTRMEWLMASNTNRTDAIYSWEGPYLRDKKGKFLCNFKTIGVENIYYDENSKTYKIKDESIINLADAGSLNNRAPISSPIDSYKPNAFDVYNMNGNVAELVNEGLACGGSWNSTGYDVRNESTIVYKKPSCMIGFRPVLTITKK